MAYQGCADRVAQNFAVSRSHVHFVRARSLQKHAWEITATVGHAHMVYTKRESGELLDLRGRKL